MLAERKFNTIENLITQVLIDMEINHEEFNERKCEECK